MITLTPQAATAIQDLVSGHPGAGLRILPRAVDGEGVQLGLELTSTPAESDEVVVDQGSQVFIDEQVAPMLDGKTLDAQETSDRGVQFRFLT